MWPFKKRSYPPKDQILIEESWKIRQGSWHGKPLLTRFNAGLLALAGHPDYPWQVGIAVPLRNPREDGWPNELGTSTPDSAPPSLRR